MAEGTSPADLKKSVRPIDDSRRRLQAVLDNATVAIFLMDERQHCIYMNHAAEALTGYTFDEVREADRPLHDIVHHTYPDGRHFPIEECAIDRVFPERNRVQGEEIFVHKDGSFYPVAFTASPIRDEESQTIGTIIEVRGIAEEKAREAALREQELLLRNIGESSADLIYAKDRDSRMLYANPATINTIGKPAEEVLGNTERDWHHDAAEAEIILANDRKVMETGKVHRFEETFTSPGEPARYYVSTKSPMRDAEGKVVGLVGVTSDITERREAEERQRLLLNELNHRVKNTLATVQSIAWQSFKDVDGDALDMFSGRLAVLARSHDVLMAGTLSSADITDIVNLAVEPFDRGRFEVHGNPHAIHPKAAGSIAMVLHELATNALKYGALSTDGGIVRIEWEIEGRPDDRVDFHLEWHENGGPPVNPPGSKGFGTRLIERQVALEFDGDCKLDFRPEGLVCTINLLLPSAEGETYATGGDLEK